MKHYKSVEFLSNFRVSSPPAQTQRPPQKCKASLLKTFWRRFCSYSWWETSSTEYVTSIEKTSWTTERSSKRYCLRCRRKFGRGTI